MRRKLIVLSAIFGLLATTGVASAVTEEDTGQEPDTTFNFGYDEDNGVFAWGASDIDDDCTLENGTVETTYTRVDGSLMLEGDLGEFEECPVSGDLVAGPQGQINHGMFMKLFKSMFTGPGRGCLVRHIAQSDLGEGEQQVRVGVVETDPGAVDPEEGTIEFETVMTKCNHGPAFLGSDSEQDETGPPAHAGRPDHAGPPDHAHGNSENAPGNSGNAPGRNK